MSEHKMKNVDAPSSAVVVGTSRRGLSRKNIAVSLVAGVMLILVSTLFALEHNQSKTKLSACASQPTDKALLKSAVAVMDPTTVSQLTPIVARMQTTKCYRENPNYLYVVTAYHVYLSNSDSATQHLAALQKVYNPDKGFDALIPNRANAIADLKEQVAGLQAVNKAGSVQVLRQVQP